ncbi:MAG: tRNA 2-selenouridine(34) synthase MnmH [Candidatus Puniceispirillaceae bacterium]
MPAPIDVITNWRDERISEIIDVRSPAEFADDHIPGAINLPVFTNEQRAHIGTLYKQTSPFVARREGAALVSANIAHHIETTLCDRPENWRPLIHCWRGGQRSRAFAHICGEIGWASFLLEGGYKTYRGAVLDSLKQAFSDHQICIISGATGTGKTHLLHALARKGAQTLDLEGLAQHKGSLLGAVPGQEQPSQRFFESRLFKEMEALDKNKVTFIEAESSRVGNVSLPMSLWHKMAKAPKIELQASLPTRLILLKQDYAHLMTPDNRVLDSLITGMVTRHGHEMTQNWRQILQTQDYDTFITQILQDHYDPAYQRATAKHDRPLVDTVMLSGPLLRDFESCADEILKFMKQK